MRIHQLLTNTSVSN